MDPRAEQEDVFSKSRSFTERPSILSSERDLPHSKSEIKQRAALILPHQPIFCKLMRKLVRLSRIAGNWKVGLNDPAFFK